MDPDLSAEQRMLKESTERFIEASLPLSRVREMVNSGARPDPSYRRRGADLGWYALLAPEDLGGGSVSGSGLLDAVILAELHGRFLQPLNLIDTNVVVVALCREGNADQRAKILPSLIAGEASAAWAVAGPGGDWSPTTGVECRPVAGGYELNGSRGLVVEADTAEWFLVSALAPEGLTQFLLPSNTPGLRIETLSSLDLTRTLSRVHFEGVEAGSSTVVGVPGDAAATIDEQMQIACILSTAGSAGAMQYLFDLTVEYCKDRIAFGRPIGSFQAVKHQLADTSLAVEMSHAVVTAAARSRGQSRSSAAAEASMAKAFVAEAGVEVAHKCWQNFGGISYTWDHDFHLYLRRLTTDATLYGPASWHRERVCQLSGI